MLPALVLLLCVYLVAWVPLRFANELFASAPSLDMRGIPALLELAAHAVVALMCATAGWMVWIRSPAAVPLSEGAVVASFMMSIQSLFWTVLPSDVVPGHRLPLAAIAFALALFWLALIELARRRGTV